MGESERVRSRLGGRNRDTHTECIRTRGGRRWLGSDGSSGWLVINSLYVCWVWMVVVMMVWCVRGGGVGLPTNQICTCTELRA